MKDVNDFAKAAYDFEADSEYHAVYGVLTSSIRACVKIGISFSSNFLRAAASQSVSRGGATPGTGASRNVEMARPARSPTITDRTNQADKFTSILVSISPLVSPCRGGSTT